MKKWQCAPSLFFGLVLSAQVLALGNAKAQPEEDPAVEDAQSGVVKQLLKAEPPTAFDRVDFEDGLPELSITGIVQDKDSFVWLGTGGGLARFDGMGTKVFKHDASDESSLSNSTITSLAIDQDGTLWVGTVLGLNRYLPDTHGFERSFAEDEIRLLHASKSGDLWVAATSGLFLRKKDTTEFVAVESAAAFNLSSAAECPSGEVWFGTVESGLVRFSEEQGFFEWPLEDTDLSPVSAVLCDHNNDIWYGTPKFGLYHFNLKTKEPIKHDVPKALAEDAVTFAIFEDSNHNVWIGTDQGIYLLKDKSTRFLHYESERDVPYRLSANVIANFFEDKGGVIWVGTHPGGANLIDPLRMAFGRYSFARKPTLSFEADGDKLWVGTADGDGLLLYDQNADPELVRYTQLVDSETGDPLPLYTLWSLLLDSNGVLWLGTDKAGLISFDPKTERALVLDGEDLPVGGILDLLEGENSVWMGTTSGGLGRLDLKSGELAFWNTENTPELRTDTVNTVFQDKTDKNYLWLGSNGGGLMRFDKRTLSMTSYDDPKDTNDDYVYSVHQDASGALWLGTAAGLGHLAANSQKIEQIMPELEKVWCVLEDEKKKLWLTTNGYGLVAYDPATKEQVKYTQGDGLQGNQFALGACKKLPSGEFAVGGVLGFNKFNPSDIEPDPYVPPVVLADVKVMNESVEGRGALDLGYTENAISFDFAALSYASPEQNRYSFMLEGFDSDWTETSNPFANYTNLPPGDYNFRIKAASRHGAWNDEGQSIAFSIAPPPWKTWWAYTIYALLFLGTSFYFIQRQRKKLEALRVQNRLDEVERNLELTGLIQEGFLPLSPEYQGDDVQVVGYYRPADQASGDWWWHDHHNGKLRVLVGDVTGHGPGPAMVTAAAATTFRTMARKDNVDMKDVLTVMSEEVGRVGSGRFLMTMSAFVLDTTTGEYQYYSAAGLPIFCLQQQAKRPKVVPCIGAQLGAPDFTIGEVSGQLAPGERVLVFTDGIPELELENAKLLGMRRFSRMFQSTQEDSIQAAVRSIVSQADTALAGVQDDDWTFAMIEWKGVPVVGARA